MEPLNNHVQQPTPVRDFLQRNRTAIIFVAVFSITMIALNFSAIREFASNHFHHAAQQLPVGQAGDAASKPLGVLKPVSNVPVLDHQFGINPATGMWGYYKVSG